MLTNQTASMVETDQKFEISLIMPEDTLTLSAPTAENKMEWLFNLQKFVLNILGKIPSKCYFIVVYPSSVAFLNVTSFP